MCQIVNCSPDSREVATQWGAPSLVQAAFRVCVGVRSGPKGPVIVFQYVESLLAHLQTIEAVPWTRTKSCVFLMKSPQSATDWEPQCLTRQNLGFPLGYVLGRRALSLLFRSVEWLLAHLETIEAVSWTRTKSCVFHMKSPQSVTDWLAAILDKAKFRVCVGVRSGPKGPVID